MRFSQQSFLALGLFIGSAGAPLYGQLGGCDTVSAGRGWTNRLFAPQTGVFSFTFDATPAVAGSQMDTVIGLSNGAQYNSTDFTGLAVLVRFNNSGKIDARSGGTYPPSSFAYTAGTSYHFRVEVNTPQHTYSVYVTPAGQTETLLALNYAFRSEQSSLSTLSNAAMIDDLTAFTTVCNLTITVRRAGPTCDSVAAGAGWINRSFAAQTGVFHFAFDATPGSAGSQMDTVIGLANSAQTNSTDFTGVGVLVRFNSSSKIDARNGGSYPASSYGYSAGTCYHFRLDVNTPEHTYSVYVTPAGGAETAVAQNYAFRSEQAFVPALNTIAMISDLSGSTTVCNSTITAGTAYNQIILSDLPAAFWNVNPRGLTEPDLTGKGNTGAYKTYQSQTVLPAVATTPNGDHAADFNGSNQYLTVPSNPSFSIPTTKNLTWEAWIRPDVIEFPNQNADHYVSYMGKCDAPGSSPTCEWEARMYSATTPQNRCDRLSGYAFNPAGHEGSGADWQPVCGLIQPGRWLHVVAEYTTASQPADCENTATYPGSIDIWVNGVKWDQAAHGQTGCMSQYLVIPTANNSPLNIGTMAYDVWFKGAVGKVAIYGYKLSQAQITNHFRAMTGRQPTGSCGATCSF